jgi:hypothetical protein
LITETLGEGDCAFAVKKFPRGSSFTKVSVDKIGNLRVGKEKFTDLVVHQCNII